MLTDQALRDRVATGQAPRAGEPRPHADEFDVVRHVNSSVWQDINATREVTSYQFYLVAGAVTGAHLPAVRSWVWRHRRALLGAALAVTGGAETHYVLTVRSGMSPGSASDPFSPAFIPSYVAAVLLLWLAGAWWAARPRSGRLSRLVRTASDNSFGVYLSHVVFLDAAATYGLGRLERGVPWPVVVLIAVAATWIGASLFTSAVTRTPVSRWVVGRTRRPLRAAARRPQGAARAALEPDRMVWPELRVSWTPALLISLVSATSWPGPGVISGPAGMLARVVLDTSAVGPVIPVDPATPAALTAAPTAAAADPVASPPSWRRPRPRLAHVDAMRPVKQFGVVSTHSLQSFAPSASLGVGASLMLTHVTRFAFMFISAAMLVYAYPAVGRGGWRTFWRRRLLAVVLLGVVMEEERRPRWLRSLVRAGADYSYGIYLSQVLFLTALTTLGWQNLGHHLPWEVVTLGGIVIVFVASALLTALLARLPGARGTAGIARRPWRGRPAAPARREAVAKGGLTSMSPRSGPGGRPRWDHCGRWGERCQMAKSQPGATPGY